MKHFARQWETIVTKPIITLHPHDQSNPNQVRTCLGLQTVLEDEFPGITAYVVAESVPGELLSSKVSVYSQDQVNQLIEKQQLHFLNKAMHKLEVGTYVVKGDDCLHSHYAQLQKMGVEISDRAQSFFGSNGVEAKVSQPNN